MEFNYLSFGHSKFRQNSVLKFKHGTLYNESKLNYSRNIVKVKRNLFAYNVSVSSNILRILYLY